MVCVRVQEPMRPRIVRSTGNIGGGGTGECVEDGVYPVRIIFGFRGSGYQIGENPCLNFCLTQSKKRGGWGGGLGRNDLKQTWSFLQRIKH